MALFQFSNQEPGTDADIAKFCELNYGGVKFPIMKKSDVNGNNTNDVSFRLIMRNELPKYLCTYSGLQVFEI